MRESAEAVEMEGVVVVMGEKLVGGADAMIKIIELL